MHNQQILKTLGIHRIDYAVEFRTLKKQTLFIQQILDFGHINHFLTISDKKLKKKIK